MIANLFDTRQRVAAGLGLTPDRVEELGEVLAAPREPTPVEGRDAFSHWPMLRSALATRPGGFQREAQHSHEKRIRTSLPSSLRSAWTG
ncbi:hypothetical protein [Aurantimonas marina]|uniref:hypothetical protein n=1 Tax=Aurantimonas marina TaxID=2780508 RepID=UPI0019D17A14|nr:hypothetical protein [Aurantimonas marina]